MPDTKPTAEPLDVDDAVSEAIANAPRKAGTRALKPEPLESIIERTLEASGVGVSHVEIFLERGRWVAGFGMKGCRVSADSLRAAVEQAAAKAMAGREAK